MVITDPVSTPTNIRARQIADADVEDVINVLTRGFAADRSRKFWVDMLRCLSERPVPEGYPRYGFLMESNGAVVGVIILIFSTVWVNGAAKIRGNVSSWYVDPAFRSYAPMLASQAPKYKNATILNISASPHTHLMVKAWRFTRYSNGLFAAIPALSRAPDDASVRIIAAREEPNAPYDPHDRDLLHEHEDFGCKGLWCVTQQEAHPFLFRMRHVKHILPTAQLIYCRSIEDFVRFARPIGWHLARSACFFTLLDANGPIPGLIGKYYDDKYPKFFLGPDPPRMGDLAYTETAMFGV